MARSPTKGTPKTQLSAANSGQADIAEALAPFVPRLALDWLHESPGAVHRRLEGTLLFVDVSGFTALTERLAARGKVGAEEISDVIGAVFGELLGTAVSYGADLLNGVGTLSCCSSPNRHRPSERAGRVCSCRGQWPASAISARLLAGSTSEFQLVATAVLLTFTCSAIATVSSS